MAWANQLLDQPTLRAKYLSTMWRILILHGASVKADNFWG